VNEVDGETLSNAVTLIDMMRHGEPVGGSRYRGQMDCLLSEKGWAQMEAAVPDPVPWQVIVSSPLKRCSEFAQRLAQNCGIFVEEDDRFKEIGFGSWEGCTRDEIKEKDPQALNNFFKDPVKYRPDGAERLEVFSARTMVGWKSLVKKYQGQHILLVAHAGVIRMLTAHVLGMPLENVFRLQVSNAAINRIKIETGKAPTLHLHNGRL